MNLIGTSDWQKWYALGNIASQSPKEDNVIKINQVKKSDNSLIQLLNTPLYRIIKIKYDKDMKNNDKGGTIGGLTPGGVTAGGVDIGTRCIIELQTRKSDKNGDLDNSVDKINDISMDSINTINTLKSIDKNSNTIDTLQSNDKNINTIGWGIISLISSSLSSTSSSSLIPTLAPNNPTTNLQPLKSPFFDTKSDQNIENSNINIINNGLWRITVKKNPVNILADPYEKNDKDPFIGWVLLRVLDIDNVIQAMNWNPARGNI